VRAARVDLPEEIERGLPVRAYEAVAEEQRDPDLLVDGEHV